MLKISVNCLEISFFSNFNIFLGMMLGPTNLFEPSEDMFWIYDLFEGPRKKVFFRKSEK